MSLQDGKCQSEKLLFPIIDQYRTDYEPIRGVRPLAPLRRLFHVPGVQSLAFFPSTAVLQNARQAFGLCSCRTISEARCKVDRRVSFLRQFPVLDPLVDRYEILLHQLPSVRVLQAALPHSEARIRRRQPAFAIVATAIHLRKNIFLHISIVSIYFVTVV